MTVRGGRPAGDGQGTRRSTTVNGVGGISSDNSCIHCLHAARRASNWMGGPPFRLMTNECLEGDSMVRSSLKWTTHAHFFCASRAAWREEHLVDFVDAKKELLGVEIVGLVEHHIQRLVFLGRSLARPCRPAAIAHGEPRGGRRPGGYPSHPNDFDFFERYSSRSAELTLVSPLYSVARRGLSTSTGTSTACPTRVEPAQATRSGYPQTCRCCRQTPATVTYSARATPPRPPPSHGMPTPSKDEVAGASSLASSRCCAHASALTPNSRRISS